MAKKMRVVEEEPKKKDERKSEGRERRTERKSERPERKMRRESVFTFLSGGNRFPKIIHNICVD